MTTTETYDDTYTPGDPVYSPSLSPYGDYAGSVLPTVNHRANPLETTNIIPEAQCVKVPDPTTGGQSNLGLFLGWSKGIRSGRAFRQRFRGQTLIVGNRGAHPVVGPVGYSTRQARLDAGVANLQGDGQVDNKVVSKSILAYSGETTSVGTNPNYV